MPASRSRTNRASPLRRSSVSPRSRSAAARSIPLAAQELGIRHHGIRHHGTPHRAVRRPGPLSRAAPRSVPGWSSRPDCRRVAPTPNGPSRTPATRPPRQRDRVSRQDGCRRRLPPAHHPRGRQRNGRAAGRTGYRPPPHRRNQIAKISKCRLPSALPCRTACRCRLGRRNPTTIRTRTNRNRNRTRPMVRARCPRLPWTGPTARRRVGMYRSRLGARRAGGHRRADACGPHHRPRPHRRPHPPRPDAPGSRGRPPTGSAGHSDCRSRILPVWFPVTRVSRPASPRVAAWRRRPASRGYLSSIPVRSQPEDPFESDDEPSTSPSLTSALRATPTT